MITSTKHFVQITCALPVYRANNRTFRYEVQFFMQVSYLRNIILHIISRNMTTDTFVSIKNPL